MTLLKCLLILVQCKTYFHMHYVSMQPNKKTKKKKASAMPLLGHFLIASGNHSTCKLCSVCTNIYVTEESHSCLLPYPNRRSSKHYLS